MSLIKSYNEGKTELNKLKFKPTMGSNHPGNPPLATRKVPTEPANSPSPATRGEILSRLDDLARIGRIFTRRQGLNLVSNNLALSTAVNNSYAVGGRPPGSEPKNITVSLLKQIGAGALESVAFLGATLAQVAVAGTGAHFVKSFGTSVRVSKKPSKTVSSLGNPGAYAVRYGVDQPYVNRVSEVSDSVNRITLTREPKSDYSDFIDFYFEVLDSLTTTENTEGESVTSLDSTYVYFRAFLDSFDDSFSGNWNSYNYVGRGENFYTYNNFSRDVSFSFKIAAASQRELMPLYSKLNFLASTTAPTYSGDGFMRGTFVKVTVGDYLKSTPGFINSINLSWQKNYPWEIKYYAKDGIEEVQGPENTDLEVDSLPTVLDVSVNFTPVHTFTPQTLKLDSQPGALDGTAFSYIGTRVPNVNAEGGYDQWRKAGGPSQE